MSRREVTWDRKRRLAVPARWWPEIEAFTGWLAASASSATTVRLRRWQIQSLAGSVPPGTEPWDLTTDDLVRHLSGHQWSAETLKSARSGIRAFYAWAALTGRVAADPAASLPTVRVPRALPRPVGDLAFARALDAADDRTALMLHLAALAGLRAAEIARLRWADIDGDTLTVRGKAGHERRVPIHPELANALAAEAGRRQAGRTGTGYRYTSGMMLHVFPGSIRDEPLTPGAVTKTLARALGGRASAHQLRHRFASRAYSGTRDLRAVQELLGHASITTTVLYTALPDGALRQAVLAAG